MEVDSGGYIFLKFLQFYGMSAYRPPIICEQNILSPFIAKNIKEIHVFEYLIAKFSCFYGVVWHGDFVYWKKFFFRNVSKTEHHLVFLGGELCNIFWD